MPRYSVVPWYGERGGLFYVVDRGSHEGGQPHIIAICKSRLAAEGVAAKRTMDDLSGRF
jgi:hypothetical protein